MPARRCLCWWRCSLAYAVEGNFLEWSRIRAEDQLPDPFQILFGASVVGLGLALPLALLSGQFISPLRPWGAPEWGIMAISLLSTSAYSGYIWLIGRTGPVFAAQVSYLVTGFGVVWSMVLLGETYSGWIWLALALWCNHGRARRLLEARRVLGDYSGGQPDGRS